MKEMRKENADFLNLSLLCTKRQHTRREMLMEQERESLAF